MDQRFHPDTRHAWSRGFRAKNLSIQCANHCYLPTEELIPLKPWSNLNLPMLWSFGEDNLIAGWRNKKKDGCVAAIDCSMAPYVSWCKQYRLLDFALLQNIAVTTETWKSQENVPMVQAVQSHQSCCSAEMSQMEHDDEITIRSVEQWARVLC